MATHIIKEGIYSVGVLNPSLRVFDIIMKTEFGTSYNAYVVKGNDKNALIEACHGKFFDEYLNNIKEVCNLEDIDYVILNHTEPDHSGSLRSLLELNPRIKVVASVAGINCLKAITNMEFDYITAKHGDFIDLGGRILKFINSPLLHWPDSMFTYIEEDKALFPCDFLGAHFCEPRIFDNRILYKGKYDYAFKNYYDAVLGPFKQAVLNGLDKIKDLEIDIVCPSHGPVLVDGIRDCMDKYRKWSEAILEKNDPKKVSIFYVSAYNCTATLAEVAKKVIIKKGFACNMYNVIEHDICEIKEAIEKSDALMFGSPTINRDALKPIWDVLSVCDLIYNKGKLCGVFGSYGWSGEAIPMLVNRINDMKLKAFENGFKACFVPSEQELNEMKLYTERFVDSI